VRETIRTRLTLWYVGVLAAVLLSASVLTYALLSRAIYTRIDEDLRALAEMAAASVEPGRAEDIEAAARRTVADLADQQAMLVIYAGDGRVLAEQGRDEELVVARAVVESAPAHDVAFSTVFEIDGDDRHRLASTRLEGAGARPVVVTGRSLDAADQQLSFLRRILLYLVPAALLVTAIGGWALARHSLSPVMQMADRARRMGVENLKERLPVGNPDDELGRLALTFNELLTRLSVSLEQQRQFMADASHELRTPVATARTAAAVALQQPHRDEAEYRDTLLIVEQQATRLSRLVEDMFTLARADEGRYPVHKTPMYLDEVIDDVVRGARVLAAVKGVAINEVVDGVAAFTGDEDLIRRMLGNLIDNAVRHAPAGTAVRVALAARDSGYLVSVTDAGAGIPPDQQARVFERFHRGESSSDGGGAGLGLALARWIARVHGGEIELTDTSSAGTTFTVALPAG